MTQPGNHRVGQRGVLKWFARKDSNLDIQSQSLSCYHYTTGEWMDGDFIVPPAKTQRSKRFLTMARLPRIMPVLRFFS